MSGTKHTKKWLIGRSAKEISDEIFRLESLRDGEKNGMVQSSLNQRREMCIKAYNDSGVNQI